MKMHKIVLIALLSAFLVSRAAATTKTTTTLSSSLNPSTYGQAVTFTAVVSPKPPNGESITFLQGKNTLGTSTLSGGKATFQISTLTTGAADNIKAQYGGDSTYGSSTSNTIAEVVNPASTTTTVASSQIRQTSGSL